MNWNKAKTIIKENITEETDINTSRSSLRKIIQTNHPCTRYNYNGEDGFIVEISNDKKNNLDIPWSMLEKCFDSLKKPKGYNGNIFKLNYPKQASDHQCHVHVIGMIFKKAGIATSNPKEKNYYLIK